MLITTFSVKVVVVYIKAIIVCTTQFDPEHPTLNDYLVNECLCEILQPLLSPHFVVDCVTVYGPTPRAVGAYVGEAYLHADVVTFIPWGK